MPNNVFVGFPNGGTGSDYRDADSVKELQPVTTWTRDGNYQVTRRWRGTVEALEYFSNGGVSNKDFSGTYFTGASGILPGGAGRDGAISTNLQRDEGGQLGIFSATWVTSDLNSALWTGAPTNPATRGATSGDQYQESSIWTLDGNDIEKSVYDCQIMRKVEKSISDASGDPFLGLGFPGRIRRAIELYQQGLDKNGDSLGNNWMKTSPFLLTDYFGSTSEEPLKYIYDVSTYGTYATSIAGNANLYIDLKILCEDIMRGQEAFSLSQYVLRNTKTTQYNSALLPSYTYINYVWETSDITTLMAAETRTIDPPTSTVANTLPLIGVLGTVFSTSKWLYRTPDVQQLGNGKWQITKEFWEASEISTSTYKAHP
jgi:hypothetical protein